LFWTLKEKSGRKSSKSKCLCVGAALRKEGPAKLEEIYTDSTQKTEKTIVELDYLTRGLNWRLTMTRKRSLAMKARDQLNAEKGRGKSI